MAISEFGVLTCAGLLALTLGAPAGPEDYDYSYPDIQPVFLSRPASYRVRDGDSIVLPCEINDLGPYPVIWKKGRRVISAGKTITSIDRRFRLVGDNDLEISRVKVKDTGTFTCSVDTEPLMELTHGVDILYGPSVATVPATGLVVTQTAADQVLQCSAKGKPQPKIFWRKQTGRLPSGDETYGGAQITISRVTRQMAGVYECVADNGVGPPAVGRISLQVHYAPEVEVERSAVHTGEGHRLKLICFVFADPPAHVMWAREGSQLDPTRHVISEDVVMGTRHILTIRSVQRDDFDTYTCTAKNSLGSMKGRMIVTGVADRVEVTSPSVGSAPDAFDLAWRVASHSPIMEYKVAYRTSRLNSSMEQPSPWKEVIVPTTGTEPVNDILQHQKITLRNLRPATAYDLYIQASNRHGWNAVSDTFHFSTLSKGEALESRIARAGGHRSRKLHPFLGALTVLAFIILPVIF